MPNRLLTHDEVRALFEAQGLQLVDHAVSDAVRAPYVIVQEPIDRATWAQAIADAPSQVQIVRHCGHCWHAPQQWQGPLPVPRLCCWCGQSEGPQHGPYMPEGGL